jgi:hypothetical protein
MTAKPNNGVSEGLTFKWIALTKEDYKAFQAYTKELNKIVG